MITLLHTNDIHCSLGTMPRLATLIARERARDPDAVLLDAGDTGLHFPTADLGVECFAAMRYDAMVPGNAETSLLDCRTNLCRIGAPVVVANVERGVLDCRSTAYLIREVRGVRIAILGLTTAPPYPIGHPLHLPRAQEVPVLNPDTATRQWVPQLRRLVDLVVVLSHRGLERDIRLALTEPGIDLIIGGHSHQRLPSLLRIGDTHIALAGAGAAFLGVIAVEERGGSFRFSGRLEPVWTGVPEDKRMKSTISCWLRSRWPEALEVLGTVDLGCRADPWLENPWASYVTDYLREQVEADVCLCGAAGLWPMLEPGPVTEWDLQRCMGGLMWDATMGLDRMVVMVLKGEILRAVCEHGVTFLPCDCHELVPPRFCQPGNNLLYPSGLRVAYDLTRPAGQRITALTVGDGPVDPDRRYTVLTSGFLAKGYSGFHWFAEATERESVGSMSEYAHSMVRAGVVLPPLDGRLTFRTG